MVVAVVVVVAYYYYYYYTIVITINILLLLLLLLLLPAATAATATAAIVSTSAITCWADSRRWLLRSLLIEFEPSKPGFQFPCKIGALSATHCCTKETCSPSGRFLQAGSDSLDFFVEDGMRRMFSFRAQGYRESDRGLGWNAINRFFAHHGTPKTAELPAQSTNLKPQTVQP